MGEGRLSGVPEAEGIPEMTRLADCYRLLKRRLYVSGTTERAIVDDFHRLYHQTGKIQGSWGVTWRGRPVAQNPMDLLAIAGIIQKQPEHEACLVIEIGTGHGGSACFYQDSGATGVTTVDIVEPLQFDHIEGVYFIRGSSIDPTISKILQGWSKYVKVVILDGDHSFKTVLQELRLYAALVPIDGYVIVCDTHFNGHPIAPEYGPGPWEAVEAFLAERDDFVRDREVEPLFTFNPGGYLRRVK